MLLAFQDMRFEQLQDWVFGKLKSKPQANPSDVLHNNFPVCSKDQKVSKNLHQQYILGYQAKKKCSPSGETKRVWISLEVAK